ncbi:MAG: hypothetical protein HRT56_06950, partial [Coraliomargarita sp.]|nr:hypothetical protein [Coraliomargarita sp.]
IVSFFILAKFLAIAVKIISKGDANSKLSNGLVVVIGLMILKKSFEFRIDTMIPDQSDAMQLAAIYGITFAGTLFLIFWRFATPFLDSAIAATLIVGISYGHGIGMPMLSAQVLPEGKTFAEFVNLANDKIEEQKEVIEDLKSSGALQTLAAANKNKEKPSIKEAFSILADLTEEDEMNLIKNEFASGMEVIAERMAIMEAMSDEEREAYKAEMSSFMAEQGLSNNPYNLKALKSVKAEDVQDMAAFMESMQGTMGMTGLDDASESDADHPSLSSSLKRIAQNIKGAELNDNDRKALATFSSLIRKASMDEAIQKAKADVKESKGKDPIASTMLAALLETKADMPISDFIEKELGGGTAVASSEGVDQSGEGAEAAKALEIELLPIPIKRGVVRIPDLEDDWSRYLAAANAVQIKGFVVARGDKEISKVVLGTQAVAEKSKWRMEHEGRTYNFQVDEVSTGMAYLSAMF